MILFLINIVVLVLNQLKVYNLVRMILKNDNKQ